MKVIYSSSFVYVFLTSLLVVCDILHINICLFRFHRKEINSEVLSFDQISNYASFAKQWHEPPPKNIIPRQHVRI